MSTLALPCTMEFNKTGSNSCDLTFKSNVEGIATTYANLYRRALLQNTPCMSVAGLRCSVDGVHIKNFFETVPGLTGSLIDINQRLHNAVFDIKSKDESIILKVTLTGTTRLSDLCNPEKYSTTVGEVEEISLVTKDDVLATIVGGHVIELEIFLKYGVGFSQKDVNKHLLSKVLNETSLEHWIITDSQHRGVVSVTCHSNTTLGRQTVTLGIKSYLDNIEEVVESCTDNLVNQLNQFKI